MHTVRIIFSFLLFAAFAGNTLQATDAQKKFFNRAAFVGLVSFCSEDSYGSAKLDYELETAEGNPLKFTDCRDVEKVDEATVAPSQFVHLRILKQDCAALKRFSKSKDARFSYFPARLSKEFWYDMPAGAKPDLGGDPAAEKEGSTFASIYPGLVVALLDQYSARVTTAEDEFVFTLLSRADFEGEGCESLLVRVEWAGKDSMGKTTDLLLLSRTSEKSPILIRHIGNTG